MSKHEKKSTLKIQLLGAVGMLLIATVALTGATYAWFTFVSNPQVSAIDMYVQASNNILFSPYAKVDMDPAMQGYGDTTIDDNKYTPDANLVTDPYNDPSIWFSTVTQRMIQDGSDQSGNPIMDPNYRQQNSFPSLTGNGMQNVSSLWSTGVGGLNFFTRQLDSGGVPKAYTAAGSASIYDNDAAANGYIQFSLWVKSNTDGTLYLDGDAGQSFVQAIDSAGGNPLDYAVGSNDYRHYIQDAIRVGFYTDSEGSAANLDDGTAQAVATLWEPNSLEHLPSYRTGVTITDPTKPLQTLAITQADDIPPLDINGNSTENMAVGGEGGKTAQTTYDFIAGGTNLASGKIGICALKGGSAVKLTFAIWVEGADIDTTNDVANSFFRTALVFGEQ